ncbi:hypothetical protein [Vreelandella stevensii]|uniref:hypothetical protein n=1 Tax=Vreelandella stevensii TaxID=502821 RepID=UPI00403A9DEB
MIFKECGHNDTAQINEWYKACEEADQPYVLCLNRTKLSKVEWDFITLSRAKEHSLFASGAKVVMDKLQDIYRKYGNPNSKFYGSAGVGYMDNLLHGDATEAANEVALLLRSAASSTPQE